MSEVSNTPSVRRDIWRVSVRQLWLDPRTGFSNLRFLIGMWIGGFSSATKGSGR